jgi:hypothetical protein
VLRERARGAIVARRFRSAASPPYLFLSDEKFAREAVAIPALAAQLQKAIGESSRAAAY